MRKIFHLFIPLIFLFPSLLFAENLTLTTYYPSPFGVYDQLRLFPRAPLGTPCKIGTLYVTSPDGIQFCQDDGTGTGAWGHPPGIWDQLNDDIYLSDTLTNPNIAIGIGTITPNSRLTIKGIGITNATASLNVLDNNDTSILLIKDDGNIGFGTITPASKLTIKGAGTTDTTSSLNVLDNADTSMLYVADDGKIGVGTTTPSSKTTIIGSGSSDATSSLGIENDSGTSLLFVRDDGFVGIGTSAPNNKLQVTGLINFDDTKRSMSLGFEAGKANTGVDNIFIGTMAGTKNTTAYKNTVVGSNALKLNTGGDYNSAYGYYALFSNATGDENTAIGTMSLFTNTLGKRNTGVGMQVLGLNKTGEYNTAVGAYALSSNSTGRSNCALGVHALKNNKGNDNVGIGVSSLQELTTGNNNIAIGSRSGYTDISGNANRTGSNNVFIGHYSGPGTPVQLSNAIAIGAYSKVTASNSMVLGGTGAYALNVGIGLAGPTAKLHVNGNIKAVLNDISGAAPANMRYNSGTDEIGYDVAELFETTEEVEIGDLLVISKTEAMKLQKCRQPYEKGIVGVVSGAPAILFEGSQLEIAPTPGEFTKGTKPPVALAGRILCKVSTENGAIDLGDLLTSSSTPGHAMKATDREKSFGTIVGRALQPFSGGPNAEETGQIIILATLQ